MTDYKSKLGLKPADIHMIVSHTWRSLRCFKGDGTLMLKTDALTEGVNGDYHLAGGDTPLGTYRFTGEIVKTSSQEPLDVWASYGPYFLGLHDVDGQERILGRAGIGMHGGRQGRFAPDPNNKRLLYPTHGCIRVYDDVLTDFIVPAVRLALRDGKAFVSVVS